MGQGVIGSTPAAYLRSEKSTNDQQGPYFRNPCSQTFFSLHQLQRLATVSSDLAGDPSPTARDRHTCTYQQLEEVLGRFWVLGKLLETKTGQGHFMSGIICKNHPGLSQDNFSKVESLSYTFNWKSALMVLFQTPSTGFH